jgi:hypothetical protein
LDWLIHFENLKKNILPVSDRPSLMGSNDTEWELEEGIPQVEEPFIQQYLKGRDALVLEEQKQRHGQNSHFYMSFNSKKLISPA